MFDTVILLVLFRLYKQSNSIRHCLLSEWSPADPLKNDANNAWKLAYEFL